MKINTSLEVYWTASGWQQIQKKIILTSNEALTMFQETYFIQQIKDDLIAQYNDVIVINTGICTFKWLDVVRSYNANVPEK